MADTGASKAGAAARGMILPLALAQFIASYAATNMNVAMLPRRPAARRHDRLGRRLPSERFREVTRRRAAVRWISTPAGRDGPPGSLWLA